MLVIVCFNTQVKLEEEKANILYDSNITSTNNIRMVIEKLGYEASPQISYLNTRFFITGMRCNKCVLKVESNLKEVLGVTDAKVRLMDEKARGDFCNFQLFT